MNRNETVALLAAYRRTHYHVLLEPQDIVLQIDRYDAQTDRLLCSAADVRNVWSIITPCNPRSQPISKTSNLHSLRDFHAELNEQHLRWIAAVNRDPRGEWPDEPGVLLCDPPSGAAEALGHKYRQNAIVEGKPGFAPYLVWLQDLSATAR